MKALMGGDMPGGMAWECQVVECQGECRAGCPAAFREE